MTRARILITGTTSGLGRSLLAHYSAQGHDVIAVDRRRDPARESEFPTARFHVLDIGSPSDVEGLMADLDREQALPDVFFLNAGINRPDNLENFDLSVFQEVLRVNLVGALTFVSAVRRRGLRGRTLVGISSTSVLVPNAGSLGYFVSKLSLQRLFGLFATVDPENRYKTVLLGPMHSRLNRELVPLGGIQKRVFEYLSEDSGAVARRCARFVTTRSALLRPPLRTRLFYGLLAAALRVRPTLYYRPHP